MYCKTWFDRLSKSGWTEARRNDVNPFSGVGTSLWKNKKLPAYDIEFVFHPNKDGTPGRIVEAYQGGHKCQV